MISKETPIWVTSDSRQEPRLASSLRAGTIMEICGGSEIISPAFIGDIENSTFGLKASGPQGLKAQLYRVLNAALKIRASHSPRNESIIISGCNARFIFRAF